MRRLLVLIVPTLLLATGCGGDGEGAGGDRESAETFQAPEIEDPGPIHVHGLGVNPADGALFVATHTGLFRAPPGEPTSERVADNYQDTMGFTVIGPDRFLGSGHPGGDDDLPPFLGLIDSDDAGESWEEVSLMGKADFHVLEAAGEQIYGFGSDFESRQEQFLVSDDGGESWQQRDVPESLLSLAISPGDPDRVVASGQRRIFASDDGGQRWRDLGAAPGLVGWDRSGSLYLVDHRGAVSESADGGESWKVVGRIGGRPAAFEADIDGLYAALHDGTIKRSTDGGRTWAVRSRPQPVAYAEP